MTSDYQRSSRACAFNELRPDLIAAIHTHAARHALDDPATTALACCETTSVRIRRGIISRLTGGSARLITTGAVITPHSLIWATDDGSQAAWAMSAQLAAIEVRDFASPLIVDHGVEVQGFLTSMIEPGTIFIGLGPEPAGEQFAAALKAAVRQVRDAQPRATAP